MLSINLPTKYKKIYIKIMMTVISRGLVSASRHDSETQQELTGFAIGTTIQMLIMPNEAQFRLRVNDKHQFELIPSGSKSATATDKADLTIKVKHLHLAFLLFTFQESTARAFTNDRMVADGDLNYAIRFVRCLNRMEVLILPKVVAKLAVKSYPNISFTEKLGTASKIYAGVMKSFLKI